MCCGLRLDGHMDTFAVQIHTRRHALTCDNGNVSTAIPRVRGALHNNEKW